MAEKCEPKQNKCDKAGTGPHCSQDAKYGGPAKAACLETVKDSCERDRGNCINDCFESLKDKYETDRENEDKAFEAASEAAGLALKACWATEPYKRLYGYFQGGYAENQMESTGVVKPHPDENDRLQGGSGYMLQLQKISTIAEAIAAHTGKNRLGGPLPPGYKPIMPPQYRNASVEELKALYEHETAIAEDFEDRLGALCPGTEVYDPRKDRCIEIIKTNGDIAQCVSGCWRNSQGLCNTEECMCGTMKCEGPDIKPDIPPDEKPSTTPQSTKSYNQTHNKRSITSTLSQYGVPIELLYGREFLMGNVVWLKNDLTVVTSTIVKTSFDESTHKNVSHQEEKIDNYISFHVGLCAGPVDAITRVWLEGGLVYDKYINSPITTVSQDRLRIRVLEGKETAKVQAEEALELGFGRVPAYRGLAGAFIKDINLSNVSQFPSLRFEVIRDIRDASVIEQSSAIENLDANRVAKFDFDKRRIMHATTLGDIVIVDYDTLSPIRSIPADGAMEVTSLPSVITYYLGGVVLVNEMFYGDVINAVGSIESASMSFMFRYVNSSNEGSQLLGLMADTQLSLYTVDDVTGRVTLFAEVPDVFGGVAETVTPLFMNRRATSADILSDAYSVFLARSTGTQINVAEMVCYNTDQHDITDTSLYPPDTDLAYPEIADGHVVPYTISDIFEGATDVALRGALASGFDNHVIFFVTFGGEHCAIKWHPDTGVVWQVELEALPDFGKYSPARRSTSRLFAFMVGDVAYQLDLELGLSDIASENNPVVYGPQYFDNQLGAITYFTDANTLARVYADRVNQDATSVADIIRDVCRRSGLDYNDIDVSDVEDIEILGFRSGNSITGQSILTQVDTIWPTISYTDDKIVFLNRSTVHQVTVDVSDLGEPLNERRLTDAYDTKSATVAYDSNQTELSAEQTFSLPDDSFSGRNALTFSFPALLDDDYARSLAEVLVFAAQENDTQTKITLPPRYLYMTPTDMAEIITTYRVKAINVGWDLSSEVDLYYDSPNKYSSLVELSGVLGFAQFSVASVQKNIPSLITFPTRTINPDTLYAGSAFYAPVDIVGPFDPIVISVSDDEKSADPGSLARTFNRGAMVGRLVTPPASDVPNPFTTQETATMVVKFGSAARASQLVPLGQEYVYQFYSENLLWVGEELIQYLYVTLDPDGVTATFTGLLRARFNTTQSMVHNAGELVVLYEPDVFGALRLSTFNSNDNNKLILTKSPDASERRDVSVFRDAPNAFRDLGAHLVKRGESEFGSIFITASAVVPHGPRYPITTYYDAFAHMTASIYLLRADYDEATFDFWRDTFDGTDFSYMLTTGEFGEVDASIGVPWGFAFYPELQDEVVWDRLTEPLVAVIITSGLGIEESRVVTKWTPGDYVRRPMRGIRNG